MRIPDWRAAFGLSDLEVIAELDEIVAAERALAVRRLELVGEVSGRGIARAHGCSSVLVWLRNRYRIGGGTAAQMTGLAKLLPSMPHLAKALAAGDLSEEQTAIAAEAVAALPQGLQDDGQHHLIDHGSLMEPKILRPFAEGMLDVIAPDVGEERARKALEREEKRATDDRSFTISPDGTGRWRVHGYTSAEGAAILNSALDPLCNPARYRRPDGSTVVGAPVAGVRAGGLSGAAAFAGEGLAGGLSGAASALFGTDACGAGPDRGGDAVPTAFRDPRTPAQRRHDALLEVFGLCLNTGELPENGGDKAQVVVTMPLDPLSREVRAGLLDNGAKLTPEAVRRLACDAGIIPAICDSAGIPLDLGRERRLITGALRRALVLRDRGCAFPGCDRPPRWCQGHHRIHWTDGGTTCLANSVLLCGFHHGIVHHGDWTIIMAADGIPEFVPPAYLDPLQRPRRNVYHRRT